MVVKGKTEVNSFGFEQEFPIVKDGEFIDWSPILDRLVPKLQAKFPKCQLYRDGTPCAEYTTQPHTDYNKVFAEFQEAFQMIAEKFPKCVFFSGGAPGIHSVFSGHIHIGNMEGLKTPRIAQLVTTLHGSQVLMELLSQNFKSARRADERATRRDYFKYYPVTLNSINREYYNYTFNEHMTIENRIPPSTDFYHLLALTAIEIAWVKTFDENITYELQENWNTSIQQGAAGKYMIIYGSELYMVDYSTYVNFQLARIKDALKAELDKMDRPIRLEIEKYLEVLKRTTMSSVMGTKSIREAQEMAENLILNGISFVKDVKIEEIEAPGGKFTDENTAYVVSLINKSKECKTYSRFKGFIEGIKRQDKSLVSEEDIPIFERVLAKKKIETLI